MTLSEKDYQKAVEERNQAILELNNASEEVRAARIAIQEKMALFSAGTLSVMFTFVGVLLSLENSPQFSMKMWSVFIISAALFLVCIFISLTLRIIISSWLYYVYDKQRLDKEQLVTDSEKQIISSSPISIKGASHIMTKAEKEEVLAHYDQMIGIIEKTRKKANNKQRLFNFLMKLLYIVNFSVFLSAYICLGLFLLRLIIKTLVIQT